MANILGLATTIYASFFWIVAFLLLAKGETLQAWFSMTGFVSTALAIGWMVYG